MKSETAFTMEALKRGKESPEKEEKRNLRERKGVAFQLHIQHIYLSTLASIAKV